MKLQAKTRLQAAKSIPNPKHPGVYRATWDCEGASGEETYFNYFDGKDWYAGFGDPESAEVEGVKAGKMDTRYDKLVAWEEI
jgi:hypothetical protein